MPTFAEDLLPNSSGQNLGSPSQLWDGYFRSLNVLGTITASATDSVQSFSSNSSVGFASAVHTFVKATSGAGITLTIISAAGVAGQRMSIKQVDAGSGTTIVTTGGQTIDGASSYTLSN